ncbi:MAG: right-handed parallel beta-helix repeat-containing protein [archaeon]|nr:right-handed parallel beta-helix repeat-containing protein [archaeon]
MKKLYVSPNGKGDGSEGSPCSLNEVLQIIQNLKNSTEDNIKIILSGGKYHLNKTLVITPLESGTDKQKIIWQGKKGEFPILTSEKFAKNFTLHDKKKNIWVTDINHPDPNFTFEHLWSSNGEVLQRAWSGFNNKHLKKSKNGIEVLKSFGVKPNAFRNSEDIVMVGKHFWYYISEYVNQVNKNEFLWDDLTKKAHYNPRLTIGVIGRTGYYGSRVIQREKIVALENVYEFMETPGDLYFDRKEKKLYIIPFEGFSEDSHVIYPTIRSFIRLDGTLENPMKNIEFRNIHFRYNDGDKVHATAIYPTEPTVLKTPKQENALQINAGSNISIKECSFKNIGNEAIHFDLGGANNIIEGNAFENISGTAIAISQSNLLMPKKKWFTEIHPSNRNKIFKNFLVENNYLYKTVINNIRMGHAIAYSEFIHGLKINNNEIDHTAGHAIRNSWRYGGFKGGHAGGIEYAWNRTNRVGMKGLSDYGALYISCANNGETNNVHHNFVDGIGNPDKENIALYFDGHVTNSHFYKNVVINIGEKHGPYGNYWVGFVASRGNSAHHNWIHGNRTMQDMYLPHLTGFLEWLGLKKLYYGKRNKVYDNTFYDTLPEIFPEEAQEIIDKAGLDPKYQHIKELLQIEKN